MKIKIKLQTCKCENEEMLTKNLENLLFGFYHDFYCTKKICLKNSHKVDIFAGFIKKLVKITVAKCSIHFCKLELKHIIFL